MPHPFAPQDTWKREQEFIKQEKANHPELFSHIQIDPQELRKRVGINIDLPSLPKGVLKLSPLDFLVEEVLPNGSIVDISGNNQVRLDTEQQGIGTIYATLTKIGISTFDAIQRLAEALGIDPKSIGYAGLKDNIALTSQRISIRGSDIDRVKALNIPNILLFDISEGKGAVTMGNLKGNRFTILVRTSDQIDENVLNTQVNNLSQNGLTNFYGAQRFGSPRYLSHYYGKLLLSGKYEDLIFTLLFKTSPFETTYITNLRTQAKPYWKNWKKIEELYSKLPHTFRFELAVLNSLANNPQNNYIRALDSIRDQVKFWIRSYSSYLANLLLSEVEKMDPNQSPSSIPLPLTQDPKSQQPYLNILKIDETDDFKQKLRHLPYVFLSHQASIPCRIFPIFHGVKIVSEGAILSFTLPKGAYATTVLMSLFDIVPPTELPSIKTEDVDTKEILNTGSISFLKANFSDILQRIKSSKGDSEEA